MSEAPVQKTSLAAVLDVGSTSIRMVIAQSNTGCSFSIIENLQQDISLGDDVFSKGTIEKETVEAAIKVLRSFGKVLGEYSITQPDQIRAVATSAVREAANREEFLDRVYSATGINLETIDDAEVNRYTYLAVHPFLEADPFLKEGPTLILEVGGGSTELMVLQGGMLVASRSYRLGAFRMRETWQGQGAADMHLLEAMKNEIGRTVKQILQEVPGRKKPRILVIGKDGKFAAKQLYPEWDKAALLRVSSEDLSNFTERIFTDSVDGLVHKYHVNFSDAETLGPALLTYSMLAKAVKQKFLYISGVGMGDGIFRELLCHEAWTRDFQQQVICSAVALGERYGFDRKHAEYVASLCSQLFEGLQKEHGLGYRFGLILQIAALLHETGLFISSRSHHKHSMYLIQNSDLFGLGRKDLLLAALAARYHRKALPKPVHLGFNTLDRDSRIAVSKMAAILRVADALDESYTQRITRIETEVKEGRVTLSIRNIPDLTLERLALKGKVKMFEQVFGMEVVLRRVV